MKISKILFSMMLIALFTACSSDDDPIVIDYTNYYFDNFLEVEEVMIESANDYSFAVTLMRTESMTSEMITIELMDESGLFAFENGTSTTTLNFEAEVTSLMADIMPLDDSKVSAFESYDLMVKITLPSGTPSVGEYSKGFEVTVMANFVDVAEKANIAYGNPFAAPLFGSTSSEFSIMKDANVDLYKCIALYQEGHDFVFGVNADGDVVIEEGQAAFSNLANLLGTDRAFGIYVNSATYDSTTKELTMNYNLLAIVDEGTIPPNAIAQFQGVTDVITLP